MDSGFHPCTTCVDNLILGLTGKAQPAKKSFQQRRRVGGKGQEQLEVASIYSLSELTDNP